MGSVGPLNSPPCVPFSVERGGVGAHAPSSAAPQLTLRGPAHPRAPHPSNARRDGVSGRARRPPRPALCPHSREGTSKRPGAQVTSVGAQGTPGWPGCSTRTPRPYFPPCATPRPARAPRPAQPSPLRGDLTPRRARACTRALRQLPPLGLGALWADLALPRRPELLLLPAPGRPPAGAGPHRRASADIRPQNVPTPR